MGRRHGDGRGFREGQEESSEAARNDSAGGRSARTQGRSRRSGKRHGARIAHGQRPRPGRHGAGAERHAKRGRRFHRRRRVWQSPRDVRRSRTGNSESSTFDACGGARFAGRARSRRSVPGGGRSQGTAHRRIPAGETARGGARQDGFFRTPDARSIARAASRRRSERAGGRGEGGRAGLGRSAE